MKWLWIMIPVCVFMLFLIAFTVVFFEFYYRPFCNHKHLQSSSTFSLNKYSTFNPSRYKTGYCARIFKNNRSTLRVENGKPEIAVFDEKGDYVGVVPVGFENNAVEDIRVFMFNNMQYGVGSFDFHPYLIDFEQNPPEIRKIVGGKGKNWTPIIRDSDLYMYTDTTDGKLLVRKVDVTTCIASDLLEITGLAKSPKTHSKWRGSTNWFPIDADQYLGMLHSTRRTLMSGRDYNNVFAILNWANKTVKISKGVCFGKIMHPRIQFPTDLEILNGSVRIGYGVNDTKAYFTTFSYADVMRLFDDK